MLFTGEEILPKFEERLGEAHLVHIATAWATSGPQMDALETAVREEGLEVRAIVGTRGNTTEPSALELLHTLGELHLARNEKLFHSKVYVFECRNGASCAWIGSANFTRPGFGGGNVETVYETKKVTPILEWFEQRWQQSDPASWEAIITYGEHCEEYPPDRVHAEVVGEQEGAVAGSSSPQAQTWEPVLERRKIRSAFKKMHKTLTEPRAKVKVFKNMTVRRTPGMEVYWHEDHEYWCAFHDPATLEGEHYRNCFGREYPGPSGRVLQFDLLINPPRDGNARTSAGLFVRNDDRNGIFLARNLDMVQRVNPKKLEKKLRKEFPESIIVKVPWRGGTRRMIVLGEVSSVELRGGVAKLVGLVARLRTPATS